ncbi:MAG: sulfite exporter TauE/SafE family protein [Pseudomonadota bacterium]
MVPLLALMFFLTALVYAAVGFGGGSTYNALLVLHGTDYTLLPVIALLCNMVVVIGGVHMFHRHGHLSVSRLTPYLALSIPAAWLGGRMSMPETLFVGVLGLALVANSIAMAFEPKRPDETKRKMPLAPLQVDGRLAAVSIPIGFLAGLVGIGGGVFLTPLLYRLRWGTPKTIAAAASLFILLNSAAGLVGQLMKAPLAQIVEGLAPYFLLFPAVAIGGAAGSLLANRVLPDAIIRRLTALLLLYVGVRLLCRWAQIMTG